MDNKIQEFKLELTIRSLRRITPEDVQEYVLSAFEAVAHDGGIHPVWELKSEELVDPESPMV